MSAAAIFAFAVMICDHATYGCAFRDDEKKWCLIEAIKYLEAEKDSVRSSNIVKHIWITSEKDCSRRYYDNLIGRKHMGWDQNRDDALRLCQYHVDAIWETHKKESKEWFRARMNRLDRNLIDLRRSFSEID